VTYGDLLAFVQAQSSATSAIAGYTAGRIKNPVLIDDTSAGIMANLAGLVTMANAGLVSKIIVNDAALSTHTLNVGAAPDQAAADAVVLHTLGINTFSASGKSVTLTAGQVATLVKSGIGWDTNPNITVSDTSTNLAQNLDAINSMIGQISTINLTDTGPISLTMTAQQFANDQTLLADIQQNYALSVTNAPVSQIASILNDVYVTKISVSDSAANISSNLDNLVTHTAFISYSTVGAIGSGRFGFIGQTTFNGSYLLGNISTDNYHFTPYLWTNGQVTNLPLIPGSAWGSVNGISGDGSISVGYSNNSWNGGNNAVYWKSGALTVLPSLGGNSNAVAISSDGKTIVGQSAVSGYSGQVAVYWQNGNIQSIGSLGGQAYAQAVDADGGIIIGASLLADNQTSHAFAWQNGTMTDLGTGSGIGSAASAISADGSVIGGNITFQNGSTHAVIWKNGTVTDLGTLGGSNSYLDQLSSDGKIALGFSDTADGKSEAFIWYKGQLLNLGSMTGYSKSTAFALSPDGNFVIGTETDGSTTNVVQWNISNLYSNNPVLNPLNSSATMQIAITKNGVTHTLTLDGESSTQFTIQQPLTAGVAQILDGSSGAETFKFTANMPGTPSWSNLDVIKNWRGNDAITYSSGSITGLSIIGNSSGASAGMANIDAQTGLATFDVSDFTLTKELAAVENAIGSANTPGAGHFAKWDLNGDTYVLITDNHSGNTAGTGDDLIKIAGVKSNQVVLAFSQASAEINTNSSSNSTNLISNAQNTGSLFLISKPAA